jgi:hypothetical protein
MAFAIILWQRTALVKPFLRAGWALTGWLASLFSTRHLLSVCVTLADPSHRQSCQLRSNLRPNGDFRILARRTVHSRLSLSILAAGSAWLFRVLSQPPLYTFIVPPPHLFRLVLMPMSLKVAVPGAVNLTVAGQRLVARWASVAVNI